VETTLTEAQCDMRRGYYSGAVGILASALAWSVAAGIAAFGSPQRAIWALLVGGALIHPVAVVLCRLLGAPAKHSRTNPLAQLAGASTFWLIFSLPLAYGLGLQNPAWFFAAMLLVIGGRYLVFATLFGMRFYWVLGLVLAGAGFVLGRLAATASVVAAAGAAIELVFAAIGIARHRHWLRIDNSSMPTPSRDAAGR
jgi:hypothetical protein